MATPLHKMAREISRHSHRQAHSHRHFNLTLALICAGAVVYLVGMILWMRQY